MIISTVQQSDSVTCTNTYAAAAAAKSLQSCPTLCDPRDGSPPGSPIPGILQARTLEWVAISIYVYVRVYLSIYLSIYIYILFHTPFHYGLSQEIECSSLHSTGGPCYLTILLIYVSLCVLTPNSYADFLFN